MEYIVFSIEYSFFGQLNGFVVSVITKEIAGNRKKNMAIITTENKKKLYIR